MEITNAFAGREKAPSKSQLATALGRSQALWDALVRDLAAAHKLQAEWNSSSKKMGWSLRLKRGERNIVYLLPSHGGFRAAFALGDKAVQAARASALPARFVKVIQEARRYAEGTAVRVDVRTREDAEAVKTLAAIKLEH